MYNILNAIHQVAVLILTESVLVMCGMVHVVFECDADVVSKVAEVRRGFVLQWVDVTWRQQGLLNQSIDKWRVVNPALRFIQRYDVYNTQQLLTLLLLQQHS